MSVLLLSAFIKQDMESTEHDGDVEDYSEGEGESTEPEHSQRLIYYPATEETTRFVQPTIIIYFICFFRDFINLCNVFCLCFFQCVYC